ncbi:MAG: SpoIIE family protein phosphatase [Patescibacteria group bacterium]
MSNRHKISQALGMSYIHPHIKTSSIQNGDRLALVTDGVTDNLALHQVQNILQRYEDIEEVSRRLVSYAQSVSLNETNIRSKQDDISAIVVDIT